MIIFLLVMIVVLLFFVLKAVSIAKAPAEPSSELSPTAQKWVAILTLGLVVFAVLWGVWALSLIFS